MKLKQYLIGTGCLWALTILPLNAQQTLVDVKIDAVDILIGEQTQLHLSVTTDKGKQVIVPLPAPMEMLTKGVEMLAIAPPDTADVENGRVVVHYDMIITSFDSALYLLPPFAVIDGRDTLLSNQVALKVSTPDVNLEKPDEYYDIKDVWCPPFVLADYYALIYGILFTLFLICVIGYFIQRMRNRKPETASVKDEPKLPPHEQAIMELREVREQKLWQQGRNKEYHTEVTDILRRYISARYAVFAMEMTSSEILGVMQDMEPGNREVYDVLKQVLQLADFVKFAKMRSTPDENEMSMWNANYFVDKTKRATPAPAALEETSAATEDKPKSETEKETII